MSIFRRRPAAAAHDVPTCSCGAPIDLVDMDYGFQLPDVVFALSEDQQRDRVRGLGRVFVLDGSRGFVRALLPVRLDRGSVEFGLWLEIAAAQAEAAIDVWEEPAYTSLTFVGVVANRFAPWGDELFGATASARPRTEDALPFVHSGDEVVEALLTSTWSRDELVAVLPGLGHDH